MDPILVTHQDISWDWWDDVTSAVYQYPVFETSFVRSVGIENECLATYACSNDDNRFIGCPEENDKRIRWGFDMTQWRYGDDDVKKADVLIELLEGKDEDIWLWVDGDEDHVLEPISPRRLTKYEQFAAVQCLQRRQQTTPRFESHSNAEIRRRVQSLESPLVRLAAIAWLIISSKAMKKQDHDHGWSERTKWDLGDSIWHWHYHLNDWQMWNDLPVVSASSLKAFEGTMVANGHSCHTREPSLLARWLYIQSILFGQITDKVVNFMRRDGLECKACLD